MNARAGRPGGRHPRGAPRAPGEAAGGELEPRGPRRLAAAGLAQLGQYIRLICLIGLIRLLVLSILK